MVPAASGFCVFDSVIGPCGIAWGEAGLVGVQLPEGDREGTRACMQRRFPQLEEAAPPHGVRDVIARIRHHLQGGQDPLLDVALDMSGIGEFQRRVYAVTRAIPPGRTLSYGEVAVRVGEPGAARAVGQALGHNPFAPVVPCHRVLAARSGPGGFSADGGVATKLRLLEIEQAQLGAGPGLFD
jgi:methylated-DNA-[protein]-cysteine S-methyltransferase